MASQPLALSTEPVDDAIPKLKKEIWASGCALILTGLSLALIIVFLPFSLIFATKVCQEYERAVIFRLGSLLSGKEKGPGLFWIIPCIDSYTKLDLRVVSFSVPPQEILSKDSVTVSVDAVVYFRISDPVVSITNVNDAAYSTKLLAQTTLRNTLGTMDLGEMLSRRDDISQNIKAVLDEATKSWGVQVERVEVKDIRLPQQLMRAMATEAEASRAARAKVTIAEGELKASRSLREAAQIMAQSPAALQVRYLQTLNTIAAEHNNTVVVPLPIDIITHLIGCKPTTPVAALPPQKSSASKGSQHYPQPGMGHSPAGHPQGPMPGQPQVGSRGTPGHGAHGPPRGSAPLAGHPESPQHGRGRSPYAAVAEETQPLTQYEQVPPGQGPRSRPVKDYRL